MKILHIISSPRGSESFSRQLGAAIIEKLQAANAGSTVLVHDLNKTPFPHLEEVHLHSFFTPVEKRSPEQAEAIRHSDQAIAEIKDADVIVIDSPMYNFGIHSGLKAWVDHIARAGQTFQYGANGPEGLIKGKKVYLAIATGGVYSGPMAGYDFVEPYLKALLGFLGMTDVSAFRVEGTGMPENKETALPKAIASIVL